MTDLSQEEVCRLFVGASKPPQYDPENPARNTSAEARRKCQIDIDVHARLLQQRQVVALERIADSLDGSPAADGYWSLNEQLGRIAGKL